MQTTRTEIAILQPFCQMFIGSDINVLRGFRALIKTAPSKEGDAFEDLIEKIDQLHKIRDEELRRDIVPKIIEDVKKLDLSRNSLGFSITSSM